MIERLTHQFLFLSTGVYQTIAVQWLYYQGAADGFSLLTIASGYLGMCLMLVYLYLQRRFREWCEDNGYYGGRPSMPEIFWLLTGKQKRKLSDAHSLGDPRRKAPMIREEIIPLVDIADVQGSNLPEPVTIHIPSPQLLAPPSWRLMALVSLIDFIGNFLCTYGLFTVGSGTYQVIYSSVILFTALFSTTFLRKTLHRPQWIALFIIFTGLCLSALGNTRHSPPAEAVKLETDTPVTEESFSIFQTFSFSFSTYLLGVLITLLGTISYASVYTMSESILRHYHIHPQVMCSRIGVYGLFLVILYLIQYTLPNFERLVLQPMQLAHADPIAVTFVYATLVLAAFLHALSYFALVGSIGATATGVLQALRAIGVFLLSSYLYCSKDPLQCLTATKIVSSCIVVLGVVIFSSSSSC